MADEPTQDGQAAVATPPPAPGVDPQVVTQLQQTNDQLMDMIAKDRIAQLPESQRQGAWQQYQATRSAGVLQEMSTQMEAQAKQIAAKEFAQTYGIDSKDLMQYNDPYLMETAAKLLAKEKELGQAAGNRQQATEGGRPDLPAPPGATPQAQTYDPKQFEGTGDIAQAFKAKRAAGLLEPW